MPHQHLLKKIFKSKKKKTMDCYFLRGNKFLFDSKKKPIGVDLGFDSNVNIIYLQRKHKLK